MSYCIEEIGFDKLKDFSAVIRKGFADIAEQYGFTQQNNPTNGAFITADRLSFEKTNGVIYYGLYVDGVLCGCVGIDKREGYCVLEKLTVIPEFRHKGYGKKLVEFAIAKAREFGFKELRAGIIDENEILKNWYAGFGFVEECKRNYPNLFFTVCHMKYLIE